MTSRIIDSKYHLLLPEPTEVGGPLDHFQWKAILQSASAWEAYRRVGLREVNGSGVLDILMFNPFFPRSLKFSISAMRRHYSDATRETPPARRVSALRQMMLLELDIDTLDVDQVVAQGLHEFIDSFQDRLNQINDAVTRDVFTVLPEGESVVSPQAAPGDTVTYCVGMKCEQGLIAIADTRLTSGTAVSTGKKIAVHQDGDHAMFVLTSGLRSVRDKAITYFEERLAEHEMSLDRMYKAANMLAGEIRRVYMEDEEWLRRSGLVFDLNCIIGGQMSGDTEHHLYQIYPKGNWIEVGEGSPHAIIGEGSYGKVILDRSWHYDSRLDRGLLVGLLSFDATQTSASAVGPPVDTLVYHRGTYQMTEHRFTAEDLAPIAAQWGGAIEVACRRSRDPDRTRRGSRLAHRRREPHVHSGSPVHPTA